MAADAVPAAEVESLYRLVNKYALVCECSREAAFPPAQASHLLWGTWAVFQAENSTIDFDFMRYAKLRLDEYQRRKTEFLAL